MKQLKRKGIRYFGGAVGAAGLLAMSLAASTSSSAATTRTSRVPATKSTIELGDIGEDSGPVGAAIASSKVAAQAWEDYVNAHGGLNGHRVHIYFGDDAGSTATALSLVTTMVTQDHIVAMFGMHAQNPEGSLLHYLQQHGVPAIGAGNSGNELDATSSAMFSPTVVANAENEDEVVILKDLAPKNKKLGIIYCEGVTACVSESNTVKSFARKEGLQVVYDGAASLTAPSYLAQVLAAKSAGAQELVSIEDPPATVTIIQNAAQQNWFPFVEGSPVQYSSNVNLSTLPAHSRLVIDTVTLPWSVSPRMAPYRAAVKKYVPNGPLGEDGGAVWVDGALLKAISSKFGATVTRSDIRHDLLALRKATLGGLTPPLTFPAGSKRTDVNRCTGAVEWSGTKWIAPLGANKFICTGK